MTRYVVEAAICIVLLLHVLATWAIAACRGFAARRRYRWAEIEEPQSWPLVSVVVPAWRERGTVGPCIRRLGEVDYPAWEVVVVAGGPDGTLEEALRASSHVERVRVIEQQPRGKNAALNAGVAVTRGDIIVLLDADSRVSPDWLRALVKPLTAGVMATTGNYYPARRSSIALHAEMEKIAWYEVRGEATLQGSGSIGLRREAIEALGGFAEDVRVGVDWDLDARLAMRGFRRAFCPRAVVLTERPATLGEWWSNELRWRRAHLSSLFRLRDHFFRDIPAICANLLPYLTAWSAAVLGSSLFAAAMLGPGEGRDALLLLLFALPAWLLLRRAALAVLVAAFRGEAAWLRLVWVPPLLFAGVLAASWVASLSVRKTTFHFKGPRPAHEKR